MSQPPFRAVNADGPAPIIFTCDHASNGVPADMSLGIPEAELQRHIAWDIGAAGITEILARRFDAPGWLSTVSRLVIDCNRGFADASLIPEVSDGTAIPANRGIGAEEKRRRWDSYHQPYHAQVAAAIERKLGLGQRPLIVAVHSMTPSMRGKFRPWQIAMCSYQERALNDRVLAALRRNADITVGDNEPYNLDPAEDYSVPQHAFRRDLPHLQVEFRQDEIADSAGQARWARIFGDAMEAALTSS